MRARATHGEYQRNRRAWSPIPGRPRAEALEPLRLLSGSPTHLAWCDYIGEGGPVDAVVMATDGAGNVYVAESTGASTPASGGFGTSFGGGSDDVLLAKIHPDGSVAWSTYLGGSDWELPSALAVDASGDVYVLGWTASSGWTSGGFDTRYGGGDSDGFVAKVHADGSLGWSSYLGGSGYDMAHSLVVDASGNVYVAGDTLSSDWVSRGFDTSYGGGSSDYGGDGFVVKIHSNGSLAWSSYLGGSGDDAVSALAVDASGNLFAVGSTSSPDWVSGGFDTSFNGDQDGFVVKINPDGSLAWSTYLGGSDWDLPTGLAVGAPGGVYVIGQTDSSDWVSGGFDTSYGGGHYGCGCDGFVAQINAEGNLAWSSYLGGSDDESTVGLAVDACGGVYVAGSTSSSDWVSGGFDTRYGGGDSDGFVVKVHADGSLAWSTYVGTSSNVEDIGDLALDAAGDLYVVGHIWLVRPGGTGGFGTIGNDVFLAKIGADGSLVGSIQGGGSDSAGAFLGLALDASGNAYVGGTIYSNDWVSKGLDPSFEGIREYGFVMKFTATPSPEPVQDDPGTTPNLSLTMARPEVPANDTDPEDRPLSPLLDDGAQQGLLDPEGPSSGLPGERTTEPHPATMSRSIIAGDPAYRGDGLAITNPDLPEAPQDRLQSNRLWVAINAVAAQITQAMVSLLKGGMLVSADATNDTVPITPDPTTAALISGGSGSGAIDGKSADQTLLGDHSVVCGDPQATRRSGEPGMTTRGEARGATRSGAEPGPVASKGAWVWMAAMAGLGGIRLALGRTRQRTGWRARRR